MSEVWNDVVDTPCLVYDESILLRDLRAARRIADNAGALLLFSLKACYVRAIVERITGFVDGFSCSSPYETRFAAELAQSAHLIHLTSPALTSDELTELQNSATHISLNSLSQWKLYQSRFSPSVSYGLRLNPQQSFVADQRYDPCRRYSHLGVSAADLHRAFSTDRPSLRRLQGLHFHTNCDAVDFGQLKTALEAVLDVAASLMPQIKWLNLGGGYLVTGTIRESEFAETARHAAKDGMTLIFEPGSALVDDSGSLVTTVLDVVQSDGKTVAIVDSSVNHLADILDFDYHPRISGADADGAYEVIVVGRSCLAGDVFGVYRFDRPITPGMRLTFIEVGAYSLSKATMFNGLALPSVCLRSEAGEIRELARYEYEDFRRIAGDR